MGVVNKVMLIIAAAVGVVCTMAAVITMRGFINQQNNPSHIVASITLVFLAMFVFAGVIIFVLVTWCASCEDKIVGIVGAVCGAVALFLVAGSYCARHKLLIDGGFQLPIDAEWIFGGILTGVGVILVAITIVANQ